MKRRLLRTYQTFSSFLFDPILVARKLRGLPFFARNAYLYWARNRRQSFEIRVDSLMYASYDRFGSAGHTRTHYFWQDLWAARKVGGLRPATHVDVGSRLDGFVSHVLPFCPVTYVDLRSLNVRIEGLTFRQGSLANLPFADDSVPSLSCLHVLEHLGLGRYGDPVDPDAYLRGARELARVLAQAGTLLFGTPVGTERLCFDAHRVFDPQTVCEAFSGLSLEEFSLITDTADTIVTNASFAEARRCEFGCGLFVFKKTAARSPQTDLISL